MSFGCKILEKNHFGGFEMSRVIVLVHMLDK